jgi:aldose 1-epimerase
VSLNGTIIQLAAGDYAATLASSGATLAALTHAGRDLIMSFDPAVELGAGYQGRTLAPWPNRISDGRYSFDGADFAAPRNEHSTGAALHGLASFVSWGVEASASDSVTFVLDLPGTPSYPFDVRLRVQYLLDAEAGLFVLVSGTNEGATDAPLGLSAHPYLTCSAPVDECVLGLVAEQVLLVDQAMRPAELVSVEGTDYDFRTPGSLDGRHVDHAFTVLPEGGWTVVLTHPENGGVVLASDAPWVQAFTGDTPDLLRGGVAVEPMTCPPDGFNSDPEGVRVRPGETKSLRYTIRAV